MTIALFAGGLLLVPSMVLAQSTAPPTTNAPAPDTIGPRELQNFNLNGTVTRPAETPPAGSSTRAPARRPSAPPPASTSAAAPGGTAAPPSRRPVARPPAVARKDQPPARAGDSLARDFPITSAPPALSASAPPPDALPSDDTAQAPLATGQQLLLWPWLLLAAVIGAAAAFFLMRRNARGALADGPSIDAYVVPEPEPAPRPASSPAPKAPTRTAPAAAPKPAGPAGGVVSTRLRPWVEIAFVPLGCIVDEERVTVEFEVQVQNSGSALARDILVEASIFNAGPTQEQDIGRFFAEPVGQGDRIQALPPLQSMTIRTALVAPRANIQLFELAGQQVFVPLVAFNALYQWSGGRGQTSLGYLLGRETKGEKLGPLRLDLGPRAFTKLGTRMLPTGLRK